MSADLEDVYDELTIARLERRARPVVESPPRGAGGWRGRTAAGALVTGLALGLQDVLDPPHDDPIIEEIDVAGLRTGLWVTVDLVEARPRASRATVDPSRANVRWLYPQTGG